MAHSLLSVPMNLGVLDPREVVDAALAAHADGAAPLNSVEGFVRQIVGWRDWMWHLYWHLGERYVHRNALHARRRVPDAIWELDAGRRSRRTASPPWSRGCTSTAGRTTSSG